MLSVKINLFFQKALYLMLLLLQVNFFNLFGSPNFYQMNSDNSKVLVLFLVTISVFIWVPIAITALFKAKERSKHSFNWLIIGFLFCWVAVLFGSSSVYQISLRLSLIHI